jgi:hypothetical protein
VHTVVARAGGRWIVRPYPNPEHETGGYARRRAADAMCATLLARRAASEAARSSSDTPATSPVVLLR